jgi:hypothetical protein
MKSHQLAYQKL